MKGKLILRVVVLMVMAILIPVIGWCAGQEAAAGKDDPAKPLLVVQAGHSDGVYAVAISHDGKSALSGSNDKTLKLWDVATGKEIRTFIGHSENVAAVAFSHNSKYALSGSGDKTLKLWDIATSKEILTFTGHSQAVNCVALSPDGRYILSGSDDNTLKLWDIERGKEIHTFIGHTGTIAAVAFSLDNKYALSGSRDTTLKLWDVATGKEIRTFTGHSQDVTCVALSPDGRYILSGSDDNTLKLWDIATGKEIRTFIGFSHSERISSIAFCPDAKQVLSLSKSHTEFYSIRLWDVESGKEIRMSTAEKEHYHLSVAFSPDGRHILSGKKSGELVLWDTVSGKKIRRFIGQAAAVVSIALSSDGRYVLVGGGILADGTKHDPILRLWDLMSGKDIRSFAGHSEYVTSVAISPDGKSALSGSENLKRWDVATGKEILTFDTHLGWWQRFALSPDGKYVLSGSDDDNTLKLWDVATGKAIRTFNGHFHSVRSVAVAFAPDGKCALSASYDDDSTLTLWDIATGEVIRTFTGHSGIITSIAFSMDNKYAISGSYDNTIKLWDITTGREIRTFSGHSDPILALAFSPDGKYLLSYGAKMYFDWRGETSIKLWDVSTGKEVRTFSGHSMLVFCLAFTPDSRYAFSGSMDKTMILWDISTGRWLVKLISFTDGTWAVVDSEGRFDASNGGNVEGLHWVVNNIPIDLWQLKERYYEPGLLAKIMGYNKEPLRKVEAFISPKLFPDVRISQGKEDPDTLKINLSDQGGGIGKVRILVNGKETMADARGKDLSPDAKALSLTMPINPALLVPGKENKVEVIAWNREGYLSSRGTVLTITPKEERVDLPELYAIVVGVSRYSNPALNLAFSGKDAHDMARAITISAKRLFGAEKVHLTLLTDYEESNTLPTKENIIKAFESAQKAKPTDILVIYLSGHGVMSPGEQSDYHYLTREARTTELIDPGVRRQTALSSMELIELVKKIPARFKQVMILDTCAAGGMVNRLVEKRTLSSDQIRALDRLKDRTGVFVLMGSAADKTSLEATQYGQGLLTYSLLEGIRGAALKDERYVDVQKLFSHASERVPILARSVGGIQTPLVSSPKGQSFDIGLVTSEDKPLIPLSLAKPMVLRSVFQLTALPRDVLSLSKLVNDELREMSFSSRGGQVVYIDTEEFPEAYTLSGRYARTDGKVTVEVYLFKGDMEQGKFTATGGVADLPALARTIVLSTMKMVK
ncbi:MAG: caspase family protein [Syntrophus sp. (in: bacteria)]